MFYSSHEGSISICIGVTEWCVFIFSVSRYFSVDKYAHVYLRVQENEHISPMPHNIHTYAILKYHLHLANRLYVAI